MHTFDEKANIIQQSFRIFYHATNVDFLIIYEYKMRKQARQTESLSTAFVVISQITLPLKPCLSQTISNIHINKLFCHQ